jgi:hypothetical protein
VTEERSVATPLGLVEYVHFGLKLLVGLDGAGGTQHLPAAHVVSLQAAQQDAGVVARLAEIHLLLEHFHACKKKRKKKETMKKKNI